MKEKIFKKLAWLSVFSAINVERLTSDVVDVIKDIAKEYPNDAEFGAEIRRLINE